MQAASGYSLRPLPPRALVLSLAALAVPLAGAIFFPESLGQYRILLWMLALVPAFLLAHYRGWPLVSAALAVGMVLLSLGYVTALLASAQIQDWPLFLFIVSAYIGIALGFGWLSEVREAEDQRWKAQDKLEQAYQQLQRSHEELKAAQLQLIQAEKLESVGRLAAGVAHEVKNPLMTLLTGVHYLREHAPTENPDVQGLLHDMWLAVKRADFVIRELLNFSTPRELYMKVDDLNGLVERTLALVKHELDRSQVTVVRELAHDIPPVTLDSYKIQQVLVNIFTNAAQAMPAGGTLTVRTYLDPASAPVQSANSGRPDRAGSGGPAVVVEVDDTGPGIPEDKLPKVFDPFFTTKPTGQGTGLGLAVARQIVEMHNGKLSIANRDPGGVRATIVMKLHPEEAGHGTD
ncbi:MAG: hypothetical protein HY704_08145 [Gemmatimonadetes bacterium]|nr:hypothetical protein [Gemmatimonadota bacterium]